MNAESLINIESQVLLWGFVAIVVLLVLSFLRGLLRGWRYGTFRVICFFILFIVAFASLGAQANAVGTINIHQWYAGPITINYNDQVITSEVTTAFGTIQNLVKALAEAANVGSPDAISNLAIATATSAMKWVALIVDAIVIMTVGDLLVLLLWHCAFKHLIPKESRKASYKKGKLASAFEEMAVVGILMTMILSPFTSLINSVAHNFNKVSADEENQVTINDSNYPTIKRAIDTYDDSIFAKVFFSSYTLNADHESFDEQLVNFFTSSAVKDSATGAKVSLGTLMGDLSKVGSIALEGGLLNKDNMNKVGWLSFASSHFAPDMLKALAGSSFVTTILPVGLDYILSLNSIKTYVATNEGVDMSYVNWSKTLDNLATMVDDIQNAGILEIFTNTDPTDKNSMGLNQEGLTALFSDETAAKIQKVMNDLDDSSMDFLNKLVRSAMYVGACKNAQAIADDEAKGNARSATSLSLFDFLPKVDTTRDSGGNPAWDKDNDGLPDEIPTSYEKISFGKEIMVIYKTLVNLNKSLEALDVDDFIAQLMGLTVSNNLLNDDYLTDLLYRFPKVIEAAMVGDTDSTTGLITNVDGDGKSTTEPCFLDSTFLSCAMNRLLHIVSATLTSSLNTTIEGLDEAINSLTTTLDFKTELNSMFKIANYLIIPKDTAPAHDDNGIGVNFLKHLDAKPGIYYDPDNSFNSIDEGLLTDLVNSTKAIDSSKLLSKILPSLFKNMLSGMLTSLMGEGWADPAFPTDGTLGQELSKMLSVVGECSGLIRYFSSVTKGGTTLTGASLDRALAPLADSKTGYQAQLGKLLDFVATSKILNPVTTDKNGVKVANTNFLLVINKALASLGDSYKITASEMGASFTAASTEAQIEASLNEAKAEADSFNTAIITLIKSGVITTLSNYTGSTLNIASLKDIDFSAIFKAVGDSRVLSKVFVKILDDKILPIIAAQSDTDGITFANVTDWETEGASMNTLIDFASEIGDFADLKYLDSDPTCVSQIVYTLSQSQMFVKTETDGTQTYLFPDFFQAKFVASLAGGGPKAYFNDLGTDGSQANPYTYNSMKEDFEKVAWKKDSEGNYLYYDASHTVHQFDPKNWQVECDHFGEIVRRSEYIGGIDSFQAGTSLTTINPTDYDALFKAVRSSVAFGRVLTYHLFEQALAALVKSGSSLKGANLEFLWNCTVEQRIYETDCMAGLMYVVLDSKYGLLDSQGALSAGAIQIDKTSPNYCLYPMIYEISSSQVFNSLPEGLAEKTSDGYGGYTYNLTACKSQLKEILDKSDFFYQQGDLEADTKETASIMAAITSSALPTLSGKTSWASETEKSADDAYNAATRVLWKNESNRLSDVAITLQDLITGSTTFNLTTFDATGFFLDETGSEVNKTKNDIQEHKIELLLNAINSSELLYRGLPIKITYSLNAVSTSIGDAGLSAIFTNLFTAKSITTVWCGDGSYEKEYRYNSHMDAYLTEVKAAWTAKSEPETFQNYYATYDEILALGKFLRQTALITKMPSAEKPAAIAVLTNELAGTNGWNNGHTVPANP
jgi:hypothetical protein